MVVFKCLDLYGLFAGLMDISLSLLFSLSLCRCMSVTCALVC